MAVSEVFLYHNNKVITPIVYAESVRDSDGTMKFEKYYKKTDIDTKFSQVDSKFGNYYQKTDVNNKIEAQMVYTNKEYEYGGA